MDCKFKTWEHVAQSDEGLWGKECYCDKTGDICPGLEYCKKYGITKEENK